MIGPVSMGSQQDIDTALKLVKLLGDPEAAEARLAELRAICEQANQAISLANAKESELTARERDAVKLTESAGALERSARSKLAETEAAHARVSSEEASLKERSKALSDSEASLFARERQFEAARADHEASISARLKALQEREGELSAAIRQAKAAREEYETKVGSLRALVA